MPATAGHISLRFAAAVVLAARWRRVQLSDRTVIAIIAILFMMVALAGCFDGPKCEPPAQWQKSEEVKHHDAWTSYYQCGKTMCPVYHPAYDERRWDCTNNGTVERSKWVRE